MPTYDYKCQTCDRVIEVFNSFSDETGVLCAECKCPMEKQVSKPSAIHFKGSGFYETDYKGKT